MPAILRDQVWQFVGAFFGLVAIIVSIVLYRTQRRRKALSYEIISRTSLLSIEDEIKGKLEISFNGRPVQDVHLIVFKIINSGNVPIVSTDYERPVSLTFGENPQILSAEVSETNPDNLEASVDTEATRVMLEPILLNGGDSITLKVLVSQLGEISVDGRIVGVKDIKAAARQPQNLFLSLTRVATIAASVAVLVGLSMVLLGGILDSSYTGGFGIALIFGGPLLMIALLLVVSVLKALLEPIIPGLRDM